MVNAVINGWKIDVVLHFSNRRFIFCLCLYPPPIVHPYGWGSSLSFTSWTTIVVGIVLKVSKQND